MLTYIMLFDFLKNLYQVGANYFHTLQMRALRPDSERILPKVTWLVTIRVGIWTQVSRLQVQSLYSLHKHYTLHLGMFGKMKCKTSAGSGLLAQLEENIDQ